MSKKDELMEAIGQLERLLLEKSPTGCYNVQFRPSPVIKGAQGITLERLSITSIHVESLILSFPITGGAFSVTKSEETKQGIPAAKQKVSKIQLPCKCRYLWLIDEANDDTQKWVRQMPLMILPESHMALEIEEMILPDELVPNFMMMRWINNG